MEHHDKQVDGTERLFRFQSAHYSLALEFEEYIYRSQLTQADALKCAVEHWRRRKFKTAGTLFWQLSDCWPVTSWSVIDYNLYPKAAYYYAKRFFSPLLLSFKKTPVGVEVWLTNDYLKKIHGELRIALRSFQGKTIWHSKLKVELPSNSSQKVSGVALRIFSQSDLASHYLYAELSDHENLLAENRFYFREIKHLRLSKPRITVNVQPHDEGFCVLFLKARVLVRCVGVEIDGENTVCDDNYFDLEPRFTKQIQCYTHLTAAQVRRKLRLHFLNPF